MSNITSSSSSFIRHYTAKDVNRRGVNGYDDETELMFAVEQALESNRNQADIEEAVAMIQIPGADVMAKNNSGRTALDLIFSSTRANIATRITLFGAISTASSFVLDPAILKRMTTSIDKKGRSKSEKKVAHALLLALIKLPTMRLDSQEGTNLLHLACKISDSASTTYLLSRGVDGNAKDVSGNTILMTACIMNYTAEVVQALLADKKVAEAMPLLTSSSIQKETAWETALSIGDKEIIALFQPAILAHASKVVAKLAEVLSMPADLLKMIAAIDMGVEANQIK